MSEEHVYEDGHITISTRVPKWLADAARMAAADEHINVSDWLRQLVSQQLAPRRPAHPQYRPVPSDHEGQARYADESDRIAAAYYANKAMPFVEGHSVE
ncbi:MAG TPA: hypothetical protein VEJ84_05755 [Acidimicrobiales bacterium]|nr:hypothetical protein [Acidimicrobiales bacterium]